MSDASEENSDNNQPDESPDTQGIETNLGDMAVALDNTSGEDREKPLLWLWHHIGMILGIIISGLAVASVIFLAIAGFTDALVLLVIIIFGMAMVIVGGRIRGK